MATFLELVNDVERESGTVSQAQRLSTVASPAGRQEKIVGWTRQAWEMIQRERRDWTFRRKQFTATLTIGQTHYSATDLSITDFAGWGKQADGYPGLTIYDNALGRADETALSMIPYREWLARYDIGSPDNVRPNVAAVTWDHEIAFGPPPDKAYTVRGWYKRSIQALAADDDEPFIDEEHHQAIVWRALVLEAEDGQDAFAIAARRNQYAQHHSSLLSHYLEPIEMD